MLKGLLTDLRGVHGTVSSSGIRFTFTIFNFFDYCGRCGQLNGITDWFKRAASVTGRPFWTTLINRGTVPLMSLC